MKLVRCEMPKIWEDGYTAAELDEYDADRIDPAVSELYYWYGSGNYCGAGDGIYITTDGMWEHADFGHCSCYGPTEYLETITRAGYKTWQELVATFSDDLKEDCADIISALQKRQPN